MQLNGQPGDHHAVSLIGLVRRVVLLLAGNMSHQRLHAHQPQAPLRAQPLHLQPPRPGRLTRHRHRREPLRPGLRHRPVQRLAQPERLHPHRLTRQHPHIMINHRERLLLIGQVDPDHRAVTRQHSPQLLPPRVPPAIPPRHAVTLAHRTSSLAAFGTPSPHYRTRRTSPPQLPPAEQAPPALRPITTRHHWWRGYPCRGACRGRAGPHRRAARPPGVPGHRGRVRRPAGLAGRVRDRRPGRYRGHGQLRRGPGPPRCRGWYPGRGSGPFRPAGPSPAGQVRSAGCGQCRPGCPVRPGPGCAEGPGRRGGGDPGADGRRAQRPLRAGPDERPGQGAGPDRSRRPADPVRQAHGRRPGQRPAVAAAPARRRARLRHRIALRELGRRAEFPGGQLERPGELIAPLVAARAPAYSPCTVSAPTPPPCSWSRPGTTRSGCAARPPGRTCARSPRSRHRRGVTRYRLNPGGDRQASIVLLSALWRQPN